MAGNTSNIGFEKQIWDAACVLRGNIDASEYKSVVLGLIFLKYISDRFAAKYKELVEEGDGFEEDQDEYTAENIFFVPENARWSAIAAAAHTPEIGTVIDDAMRSIEKENKRLKDILPKNFARPELDKRRLGEVVDLFTNIQMIEHGNSKDILGRTYVDAYLLENSTKMIGINLSEAVYCDLRNCDICFDVMSEKIEKNDHYILRYITIDYLLDENNIRQFVKLASEANWLPHYYNALYFALKKEKNEKKVEQVFMNITHLVCDEKPSENWRLLDVFIKNSFQEDVLDDYQTRFLKHIRRHLI